MEARNKYWCLFICITICAAGYAQPSSNKLTIPLGGNSFITKHSKSGTENVTINGWENWQNAGVVWSAYIKLYKTGSLKLGAKLNVPEGESTLQWTICGKSKTVKVAGTINKEYEIGQWNISDTGYLRIDVKGISKTGKLFANVSELLIEGMAVDENTVFVKNNDDNYFYWGRRGPSVHINYDVSEVGDDIEWFYNEITVPVHYDPIGSYYMANGFGEGYFGMQVNSHTERRILFSVWSPFTTNDPKKIPDDKKIILLKKGKDVHTGEFGNEGSGGQSYLKYKWKAGETYKFLLRVKPEDNDHTSYTAYFYAAELKKWWLIASFSRPATHTYLKRPHSFLESFEPNTGYITRKAFYTNQWVKTKAGAWKPIHHMFLTADATAKKEFRMDYDGGVENDKFYLRNCGFFNESAKLKKNFSVEIPGKVPNVMPQ